METDIALASDDHLLLLWFFNLPERLQRPGFFGGDMMGYVFRPGGRPEQNWHVRYRMRYYRDEKAFGSRDLKNWFSTEWRPMSANEAAGKITSFLEALVVATAGLMEVRITPEILHVGGSPQQLFEIMQRPDAPKWLHGSFRD